MPDATTQMTGSFAGTTGLLDDADIVFTEDTRFGVDSDYQDGEVTVFIAAYKTEDGEEHEQFYSCGSGFTTKKYEDAPKGAIALREDTDEPPTKGFNKSTNFYKLLESAFECGAGETLQERGEAFDARIWHGLKFHVSQITLPPRKGLKDSKETNLLVCTEFQGVDGESPKKATKATKTTKTTKKSTTTKDDAEEDEGDSGGDEDSGLTKVVELKLKKLAKETDDHDDFIEKALEVKGVQGSDAAEAAIMDEARWEAWREED